MWEPPPTPSVKVDLDPKAKPASARSPYPPRPTPGGGLSTGRQAAGCTEWAVFPLASPWEHLGVDQFGRNVMGASWGEVTPPLTSERGNPVCTGAGGPTSVGGKLVLALAGGRGVAGFPHRLIREVARGGATSCVTSETPQCVSALCCCVCVRLCVCAGA